MSQTKFHFGRILPATNGRTISVARPASMFRLLGEDFRGYGAALARICSQARLLGAQSLVVEDLPLSVKSDLSDESADLLLRGLHGLESRVQRLCFFRGPQEWPDVSLGSSEDFLGYAILREDKCKAKSALHYRVYESVMRLLPRGHNYVRGTRTWKVLCGNAILEVPGFLFAQQNNLTNVCAHAAVRCVAASYCPQGDFSYRTMNSFLGIDHRKNRIGLDAEIVGQSKGLDAVHMKALLEEAGAKCHLEYFCSGLILVPELRKTISAPCITYQRSLYGSIESGYPAILVFGRITTLAQAEVSLPPLPQALLKYDDDSFFHAIPIFGHTFNQDMWVPRAELSHFKFSIGSDTSYVPSDLWLSAFIGHDDGLGSNYCVPQHYLRPLEVDKSALTNSERRSGVVAVLQTFPGQVERRPIDAEVQALAALQTLFEKKLGWFYGSCSPETKLWLHRICHTLNAGQIVLRAILVTPEQYADHLRKLQTWTTTDVEGKSNSAVIGPIPATGAKFWWMIEFSVMELFPANLRKLGEVIVTAEDNDQILDTRTCIEAIRLPGVFLLRKEDSWSKRSWTIQHNHLREHVMVFGVEERNAGTQ